jgi:hypothetical protein
VIVADGTKPPRYPSLAQWRIQPGSWKDAWTPDARLEFNLNNWRDWKRSGGLFEFNVVGGGIAQGYTHYDEDGEYRKVMQNTAAIMDSMISRDLKPLEREAVYWGYLDIAWLHKEDAGACLVVAKNHLKMLMQRKCVA